MIVFKNWGVTKQALSREKALIRTKYDRCLTKELEDLAAVRSGD